MWRKFSLTKKASELDYQSKTKCKEIEISVEKQIRSKRKLHVEKEELCQVFLQVMINLQTNWKHDLTPCLICKLSSLDYHCNQPRKILKASWSENLKFSVANTVLTLDISRLSLEVLWLWDFLVIASKLERDITMMTKSSANEWQRWIY